MLGLLLGLIGAGAAAAAAGGGGSDDEDVTWTTPRPQPADKDQQPAAPPPVVDPAIPQQPVPEPIVVAGTPPAEQAPETPVSQPAPQPAEPEPPVSETETPASGPDTPPAPDTQPPASGAGQPVPDAPDPEPTVLSADFSAQVMAGRVSTLELPGADIASVRVIEGPDYGHVSINPDNTIAVVLTGTTDTAPLNFSLGVTSADGTVTTYTADLDVTPISQEAGWGTGNHYKLATDADDNTIVEHGEIHQKVYVSGSEGALTRADIAALENMSVSKVTGHWLANHATYGKSADMALAEDAGLPMWNAMTNTGEGSSHWLLFERGYQYDNLEMPLGREAFGSSELNPLYIGAWGEGARPEMTSRMTITNGSNDNLIFDGLEFSDGVTVFYADNIIFEDVMIREEGINIQNTDGVTFRNSHIIDVVRDAPSNGGDTWNGHADRVSGLYANKTEGLLIENVWTDHTGWADDYRTDLSAEGGQAPSIYSQNIYINYDNTDVTLRDTITMRAASFGAQVRSGGFIEDNVFLDNQAAVNSLRGLNGTTDNAYALYSGNLVTSGAHLLVDSGPKGALTMGIDSYTRDAALVGNIVTHLADPDNPAEIAEKTVGHDAVRSASAYYDDTIIYNWNGTYNAAKAEEINQNVDGLDRDVLDQTTIQNYTGTVLNKDKGTIAELADQLEAQAYGIREATVDADSIIDYFQDGFGIDTTERSEAALVRFVPSSTGDGVRWDNRLNWDTQDTPGTAAGDSVDLGGNQVNFGGTSTLSHLNFGDGGALAVTQGRLTIEGHIFAGDRGADLHIDYAGQFWAHGYTDSDMLRIDADGGRLVNTGLWTGTTDFDISQNTQAVLATDGADFVVNGDSRLTITGEDAKVGFDGDDNDTATALFSDEAELRFVAEEGGLSTIREFYSGTFDGDAPDVRSGVNLGGVDLSLDVTDITNGSTFRHNLIEVDELIGGIGDLSITGLGSRDAKIVVDYEQDVLELLLGPQGSGSGAIALETWGTETDARSDTGLWDALTNGHGIYPDDLPADIPEEIDNIEALI